MNLYCKLPFGKLHAGNEDIIELSKLIDRSPGSVAFKLVNLASLDPSLQKRGIKGAQNSSKLDREIWNEFYNNWDILPFEAEKLWSSKSLKPILLPTEIEEIDDVRGYTRDQLIKARVNQRLFRQRVLSAYDNTCCITGIKQSELLIASHIRPWKIDESNRLNPSNGIAINALHDRAFENGLLTITPDYVVKVSSVLLNKSEDECIYDYFTAYHDKPIILPSRFLPNKNFLRYHFEERFVP